MKCTIKAFGIAREIIGKRELTLDLPVSTTIKDVKAQLCQDYPRLLALNSLFIAVNLEYAADDKELYENDEIALIPPVAGG
jgi:molybdopterin converting factor subunit 1